jgi:hypothetical protein
MYQSRLLVPAREGLIQDGSFGETASLFTVCGSQETPQSDMKSFLVSTALWKIPETIPSIAPTMEWKQKWSS